MKTILKIISTSILVLMLATLVVPVGYLAWRAGQPMDLPQFKGYTYYEYLNWRKDALHQMAVDYQTSHPNAKMGGGLDMCYWVDTTSWLIALPQTGFYALAGIFPNLEKYIQPRDQKFIPQNVTILTILPDWWKTYEQSVWYLASTTINGPVTYCRLDSTPPTSKSFHP